MTRVIESKSVKLVVYVPITHADAVRAAMGDAGAGVIGNYSHCSFSVRGQGRFLPIKGANPHIGAVGQVEIVDEDRIEMTVRIDVLPAVITAMKTAHPYEEIAYDVYPLCEMIAS
jgi:hypothetical protein